MNLFLLFFFICGISGPSYNVASATNFNPKDFTILQTLSDIIEGIYLANFKRPEHASDTHSSFQFTPVKWETTQNGSVPQKYVENDITNETEIFDFNTDKDNKAHGWTHADQHDWPINYPMCGGKRQSPINFRAKYVTENRSPTCLQWIDYQMPRPNMITSITEHTVEITSDWSPAPLIRGGPLSGVYQLEAFHFHWGYDHYDGSEHAINSKKLSLELHGVHFNTKYKSLKEAVDSGDSEALVVVAIIFETSQKSNFGMTSIIKKIKRGQTLNKPLSLFNFGFGFQTNYYSYLGSLTTPPCSEIVRWIVSADIQYITHRELNVLRTLMVDDKPVNENFRVTQPINGRTIEHYSFC